MPISWLPIPIIIWPPIGIIEDCSSDASTPGGKPSGSMPVKASQVPNIPAVGTSTGSRSMASREDSAMTRDDASTEPTMAAMSASPGT